FMLGYCLVNVKGEIRFDYYTAQIEAAYDYSPFGVTRLSYDKDYVPDGTGNTNPLAADFSWCMDGDGVEANGTGHDAVLYATTNTTNRTGETAKALRTNASSGSYMEIADDASFDFGANDFTVSIWVRKDAAPTSTVNVIAVGKWNNTSQVATNEWCLNISSPSGTIRPPQFHIAIGGTLYTAQGTATLSNTWHHLVGVREGSNIKFYLNGTLVATTAVGNGALNNVAGRDIRLGRSEGSLRTRAGFDEFLIYQRALSAGEISDLYASTCEDLEGAPGEEGIAGGGYRYGFNGMEKDDEVKGNGNSYDFGARIYDPRIGRWLNLDPSSDKYPGWSPYNFALNSPLSIIDPDGKESNRAQAVTVSEFMGYLKQEKLTTVKDIYNHLKSNSTQVPRYIYTKNEGWMDMNHLFSVFENGKILTDMLEPLSGNPHARNFLFDGQGATSYYSYEDLPSNRVGFEIIFEMMSANDKLLKGDDLYNYLEGQLNRRGAVSPEEAPNYNQIPASGDRGVVMDERGYVQPLTDAQLRTGEFVPQNFTDKPYDLNNFPIAPDSNERTNSNTETPR
ncbi:MAG: hypothetical protein H0X63_12560, partial [Flavobacteriales bacterium]|nr:hypothetical protein [Flavobacteriales bacterium]